MNLFRKKKKQEEFPEAVKPVEITEAVKPEEKITETPETDGSEEITEAVKSVDIAGASEVTEDAEVSETPETAERADTSENADIYKIFDTSEISETADDADISGTSEDFEDFEDLGTSESSGTTEDFKIFEFSRDSEAPEDSETSEATETPETPEASETSDEDKAPAKKKKYNIADFIVDYNKPIAILVVVLVIVNLLLGLLVNVNYDLTKYLPDYVPSKAAINEMRDIFGYPGTGRLMLKDVTLYEAKSYKNEIEKVDGVDMVLWCDLTTQIYSSSEFIDMEEIEDYYKDGCAVMDVTFTEGDTSKVTHHAIDEIEEIIGDKGYIVGMSPTNKFTEENVEREMSIILALAVVVIFIILLLTTTSYFEPVMFLCVIGAAVAINKGTNIFLGTISYITNNIMSIIQLATSMDYSIFLLQAYEREREDGLDKVPALKAGLMTTIKTVLSSSLTTFFGFIVLIFMQFTIGWDMGIVMAKSIICSLLMVIFFMPALLLMWSDLIDKTRHKSLLPTFHGFSVVVSKISPFVLAAIMILAVPLYIAQGMNDFKYGPDATGVGPKTDLYWHTEEINEKFGRSNLIVAIFPDEGYVKEKQLCDELEEKDYVKKVMGMSAYLPEGVFEDILPSSITELFHKDGYTRLMVYIKTKPESEAAYKYSEEVESIIKSYYGEENTRVTGNTPVTKDMQNMLQVDYTMVNNLAMISIFVVVAIAFRSNVVPIGAMIPIMAAIYLNMTFPYLAGNELIFIAYAVVSCVQLGSTIDYGILCIENYAMLRKTISDKKEAARKMVEISFPSLLTSGGILIFCGYVIYFISTSPAVGEVGHLVGRGAILSVFFVTTLMPAVLRIIDPFIVNTFDEKKMLARAYVRGHLEDRRVRAKRLWNRLKRTGSGDK